MADMWDDLMAPTPTDQQAATLWPDGSGPPPVVNELPPRRPEGYWDGRLHLNIGKPPPDVSLWPDGSGSVQLPSGADVPLPHGDPRTTSGVRSTIEAELFKRLTPAAIKGVERNVADESAFDPNMRVPDQPRFGGEAHYAHGLYQEGGDEWNNYVAWIDKNMPGADWRDPALQTRFLADRLGSSQYASTLARMNAAEGPGQAAAAFAGGYLKPAAPYLAARTAKYLAEDGVSPNYQNLAISQRTDPGSGAAGPRTSSSMTPDQELQIAGVSGGMPSHDPSQAPPPSPYPMQPDLMTAQSGGGPEVPPGYAVNDAGEIFNKQTGEVLPVTRRPSVLPLTKDAEGQPVLAMPRFAELFQNLLGGVVAPVGGGGTVFGAGAVRRGAAAATPVVRDASALPKNWRDLPDANAPFKQYAEEYPPVGPPTMKPKDDQPGVMFASKEPTPEAKEFMKARAKITTDMKDGYPEYYDPKKRFYADPTKYPAANIDTLTDAIPKKQATIDQYLKEINAPETRKAMAAAYEKGQELGNADHWYAMGQLEADYIKELGAVAGRKAFLDEFAVPMSATTSGNNPNANLLMAHYFEFLRKRGEVIPEGNQFPVPVGGRRPAANISSYEKMREGGGYEALGADQPKMHNFTRSFIGDLSRAVMDEQMTEGSLAHAPPGFANKTRSGAFGLIEKPLHEEAALRGLQPGNFQDVAWAGFKGEPGQPMISVINDAIERTHRLTGMPRSEIVRRGLIRKEIPIYGAGPSATPLLNGLMAGQDRADQ